MVSHERVTLPTDGPDEDSFVQSIADYKWDEASVAILPDVNRERTREELKDPWIAVVSPLLLFVHCEKL